MDGDSAGDTYEQQLTNLATGEIDKQLKERNDVIGAMKSQMVKMLKEFEDMTWNVDAKRSWMKSVTKASKDIGPTSTASIQAVTTSSNIVPSGTTSPPSRLPKLSAALKGRKKHKLQLSRNVSGTALPNLQASDDARSPDGKIVFDKKLPRVAQMEKRVDELQSILAAQQKQQMYERALVRLPQCRSNVFTPSLYDDGTSGTAGGTQIPAPQSYLELDFVYGMRTSTSGSGPSSLPGNSNCSDGNNVFYLCTGEVLWFTAALVVLYTKESNTQRYFREHTNEATSIGVHPNQYIVASGQAGRQTHLLVWNAKDEPLGKRFTCLPGRSVAVRAISFFHNGKLIASLGGDMYNTICVHDWKEPSLLATARGRSFRVHTIAFNPLQAYGRPETRRAKKPGQALNDGDVCYTLVSCGVRHIRFWTLTKTEYVAPTNEASEDFAFHGSAFGSPARLRPPTPHAKMWKLEGNVPSFHGRLGVQDFACLTFVDDSPPVYIYGDQAKELVATNYNDHTLGRIVAGTAKGDPCVFYQPRRSPEPPADATLGATSVAKQDGAGAGSGANEVEPAKWWEIPDEYTGAEINALVLERIEFEPTARLVEVMPHDQETGNRFKLTKQAQAEIDGITKRLMLKPNSAALHTRLSELRYGGPVAHSDAATQVAFCKKNGLVLSCGGNGRLLLWKCHMQRSVRVPGMNTLGVFTPLATGTFSEGSHQLVPVDQDTLVFQLPTMIPGENISGFTTARPTSLQWKDDGKFALVGTSSNCLWELNIMTDEWELAFEARSGAVAARTCHPAKEEVVTVSLDGYVCIWDLKRHCCKRRMHLGSHTSSGVRAACMNFHPFGDELAIGMTNGELVIIGYHELKVLGSFLAVGAKDTFVYLYDLGNNYKRMRVCEGHSNAITQLTWNMEGDLLQSNASDGELLCWSISHLKGSTKQITDAFLVRDTQWVKWTCVFGWPTPGIWSEDATSLVDIAAVCTTGSKASSNSRESGGNGGPSNPFVTSAPSSSDHTENLIAVACKSSVRLFKWPAMRSAKFRNYLAHAAAIPSLCFSFNDRYLITADGEDATIIQWSLTQGSPSPARRSPSKPSPVARKRPQRGFGDEFDSMSVRNTSLVPPPTTERTNPNQRPPRQHSRQYRERNERDEEPPEAAQSEADSVSIDEHEDEELQNDGWWLGERCDGARGISPSNYVEVTDHDNEPATSAVGTRNSDPPEVAADAIVDEEQNDGAAVANAMEQDVPAPAAAYRDVNAAIDTQAQPEAEAGAADAIGAND